MNAVECFGGHKAVILGAGAIVEESGRGEMMSLMDAGKIRARNNFGELATVDTSGVLPKDRRFLSDDDLMAIAAARLALDDAGVDVAGLRESACVAFNAGKYTRELERDHPRCAFRNAKGGIDSSALQNAVLTGSVQLNPLRLLQQLDNNVLWWLCKAYKLGGINLQLTQARAPDYSALLEATAAIAYGETRYALVGGVQTSAQSAPQVTRREGAYCSERNGRAAGAAIFFLLGGDDESGGYGTLELTRSSGDERDLPSAAPALERAMRLFRHSMQGIRLQLQPPQAMAPTALAVRFEPRV